jgi:hypothetical protein
MSAEKKYKSFSEFWPYYLSEHRDPVNRALHFAGTTAALATAALAAATLNPFLVPAALVCGYGPAWIGHFLVEKNRPATFTYPVWSFIGDFKMYGLILTGRMQNELQSLGLA